jgi:hypothetical protein
MSVHSKKDIIEDIESRLHDESVELHLELGDIIEIIAPENHELDKQSFLITYLDTNQIRLTNIASLKIHNLNVEETGALMDETIQQIHLLNRSEEKGYARQNHLLPGTWITIYFGGQFPTLLHGKITELEEDQIEITTVPENEVIYLDFAYHGLPPEIPIEKIVIRPAPEGIDELVSLSREEDTVPKEEEDTFESAATASIEYTDEGESIIQVPEGVRENENVRETLHKQYIRANDIVIIGETEEFQQIVEIPEHKKRYGIDVQTNDLMDEFLSTIPNYQRTTPVLQNIHNLITRFKQLRSLFSVYDEHGEIISPRILGADHKPLIDHIHNLDMRFRWLMPAVSVRTKIYESDVNADGIADIAKTDLGEELRYQETKMNEYFDKQAIGAVKYTETYKAISNVMRPILPPVDTTCLASKETLVEMEGIISNLEDFHGTFWNNEKGIARNKYVIQRYNLAMSKLERESGEKRGVFVRKPIAKNETPCITSLVTLPEPVFRYSQIDLPATTIGTKVALSQTPLYLFRLLKKQLDLVPEIVDDLNKELEYEDARGGGKTSISFLNAFKEYSVSDEVVEAEGDDAYRKFLNVIIPKTRILIQMIRKYITDKLSVVEVVKALQPFAIYTKDISYRQHDEIRYFIKERIREFAKEFAEKKEEMTALLNMHYNVHPLPNPVKELVPQETAPFFEAHYKISLKEDSSLSSASEILSEINQADSGTLFSDLLHLNAMALTTPAGLLDAIEATPELDDLTHTETIKPADCARRFLAKRYHSMAELQKDNSKEDTYYDKEFDETPYTLLKKYESDKGKYKGDLFLEYFAEILVQKHGCPPNQGRELAQTILLGKKAVKDGEYAILEIHSRLPRDEEDKGSLTLTGLEPAKYEYYRRKNNHWIRDVSVSEENFIDNNTLFCNLQKKCVKNTALKTCDDVVDAKDRMKEIARQKMQDEFHSRLDESTRDMQAELAKTIESAAEWVGKARQLSRVERMRFSIKQYEMGKYAIQGGESVVSPYEKIRDLIFSQADFAKRQNDIFDFAGSFCRNAIPERESEHWLYCRETNVKLLPYSLYLLAEAFVEGQYVERLNEVCRLCGEISDDGDAIVDKYSGYVLRKIEYSEEEGYDEAGFKITTHDIIEKDAATVLLEGLSQKKRIFENERSEWIYKILDFLCYKIGIAVEDVEGAVFPLSTELLERLVKSEEKYRAFTEKMKKEGKLLPPYSNYYHQILIFVVSAVLFVSIQTAIPSFKPTKVVPGCVKSFTGYPATGIEDLTGIQYLACILYKSKSSSAPWNSIETITTAKLARGIKDMLEKNMMGIDHVVKRYESKAEYLELFPELAVPKEHDIQRWVHFMPPVVPFQVRSTLHVPATHLKSEMIEHMRHGNRQQHEVIAVYQSKALLHGYGLIEAINAIVAAKEVFLKTSAKLPFLENACCNEAATNPIRYFIEQEDDSKTISKYISVVKAIEANMKEIRAISSPSILFHSQNTGLSFVDLPIGKYDINIYAAYIHYCHLDTNVPIPEDLLPVMSDKPPQYRSDWSIEEKMEFFKRNGKSYSGADLEALMKIVHMRNQVSLYKSVPFLQIPALKGLIEHLERDAGTTINPVVEIPLLEKLQKVADAYRSTEMYVEPTEALNTLKNYVKKSNRTMLSKIVEFMEEFGKQSSNELDQFHTHLEKIMEWKLKSGEDHDDALNQATTYIKNAVYNMIKGWPSILLNNVDFKRVPNHWGFSNLHRQDIKHCLGNYYDPLKPFRMDKTISLLLKEIQRKTDLYTLLETIPTFTPIQKGGVTYYSFLDKDAVFSLYQYIYYSVFYEYVNAANDSELLYTDINEKRQAQRRKNAEMADSLNYLASVEEGGEEEDEGIQEVEIEIGNQENLKTRVSQLLAVFVGIQMKEKAITNFSYEDIFIKMRKSRDHEKKAITDYFKEMEVDERRVENLKKTLKLGRWNVGNQKGLVDYDAGAYERERSEQLARAGFGELAEDVFAIDGEVGEEVQDAEDLERGYRDLLNADDPEGFTLGMLGEEYADNYDETEVEREDDW